MMIPLTLLLALLVILNTSGCQSVPSSPDGNMQQKTHVVPNSTHTAPLTPQEAKKNTSASTTANLPSSSTPEIRNTKDLEAESLFDLLTAEFAGKQNRPDVTLGNYLKQAHQTKDPEIIKRATRIAIALKAHQATLDAASLWVEVEPNNPEALQTISTQLLLAHQFDQAFVYIDRLFQLQAAINFDFLINQSARLSQEKRTELLAELHQLSEKHPDHAPLLLTKALVLQQNNQLTKSLAMVQKSLSIEPSYLQATLLEAKLLSKLGQENQALNKIAEAVERHPGNKRLTIVYARLLTRAGDLKKAQAAYKTLLEHNPNDDDLALSVAMLSWENGFPNQAKDYLYTMIEQNRKTDTVHLSLAQLFEKENDIDQAVYHFQQVAPGPLYSSAQIALADLQQRHDRMADAQATLANARITLPQHALNFYLAEAELLNNDQQTLSAIKTLDHALTEFPNDISLLYARAMLHEKFDDILAMEQDLKSILVIQPNSALALNALGYTLADRTDRYEEALTYINKAIAIKPNDPAIIDSLGWVNYKMMHYDTALEYLQKAYRLLNDHEIAAHLGEVLWQAGHQDQAKRIWQQALKNQPDSQPIQSTLERLWPEGLVEKNSN